MGLFDLFKGKTAEGAPKKANPAAKYADAAGNKRAQPYDRQEAIQELCKLKSAEAVEALLKRFTFQTDPSITDQEEKEAAFEGIIAAGKEAIEPVRAFAASTKESVAWPIRIVKQLMTEDEVVSELVTWLARWDTEYAKFIDPKLQILSALEDYKHPKVRTAVEPFLQDVSEPARLSAAAATFAQQDPAAVPALVAAIAEEESVRIKNRIADGLVQSGWEIPAEHREALQKALPFTYALDASGRVIKH